MTPLDRIERESRLLHILDAGTRLMAISSERTVSDYASDTLFQWAVNHGLMIIGEAAVRLKRIDP